MNPRALRARKRDLRRKIMDMQAEAEYAQLERELRRETVRSAIALQWDHFDHVIMYEAAKLPSGGALGQWMTHLSFSAKGGGAAAMIRNCSAPLQPYALAADVQVHHYNYRTHFRTLAQQRMSKIEADVRADVNRRMKQWADSERDIAEAPININPQMLWAAAFWVIIISIVISLT